MNKTTKEELIRYYEVWHPCTIEEYIRDVKDCLQYAYPHDGYSDHPERADKRVEQKMRFILEGYEVNDPVCDTAIEIGYSCG